MKKYNLISLAEADSLPQMKILKYYRAYVNPGIATFLKLLGFDKYKIVRSEGMYLYTECGLKIMDFSGGMSVLNHGHNHPRIMEVRKTFNANNRLEICKAFVSQYQSVLAKNLAEIFPGKLQFPFFCNSGAEANEGALKIALLYQGATKDKIIYTDMGYHGKTFATMSVSGLASKPYREFFKKLDGCLEVPYGNLDSVEKLIAERTLPNGSNDIALIILEAIKGDLVIKPPRGYLKDLSEICSKHKIVMIIDEVFTGFGRTGKMFAFEHEGIVPDIVTFSKSLGGGKASIAGYIVKNKIFKKTYGPINRCTMHTTTFGGLGEECATAIEAINIINDERLVENAEIQGEYLLSRMQQIQQKNPKIIKDTRGIGLLCIFELYKTSEVFGAKLLEKIPQFDESLTGLLPAMIISELFKKHHVLIYTGCRMDNLFINPSLIVKKEEIDTFIDALDNILDQNLFQLVIKFAGNYIS